MRSFKKNISLILFILVAFVFIWQNISKSLWRDQKVLRIDAEIYYTYLPATFIHGNPLFEGVDEHNTPFAVHSTSTGRNAVKMSMGVAILEIPFFLGGHLYAHLDPKYEPNGFSIPYHFAIALSSVVYTVLGMLLLGLFLRRKFSDLVAISTLILIGFGTNLYHYSIYETGMAHPVTFFLLSALLYMTDRWIVNKKVWRSLLIGVVLGLIILIRPINILFCIPFLFFLKKPEEEWKAHFKNLFLPFSHILLMALGAFLIVLPQLLFWKIQTGGFLYYSYREEGFFWLNSHVWQGLFSIRKGWFIYTPLMLFATLGLINLYKTRREYFLGTLIFLIPFLYVTFSWWCWWYGGGFGARTLIDILPIMAIPLAALLEWVFRKKFWNLLMIIPVLLIYLNLFQSWQYSKGYIHYDGMTWEGYKTVFLKDHTPYGYWEQLQRPDYDNALLTGDEKIFIPVE